MLNKYRRKQLFYCVQWSGKLVHLTEIGEEIQKMLDKPMTMGTCTSGIGEETAWLRIGKQEVSLCPGDFVVLDGAEMARLNSTSFKLNYEEVPTSED